MRIDGERIAFNRQHYNADIADPTHYDLVVNAGTLGVEGAAEQTMHAFRFRFGALADPGFRTLPRRDRQSRAARRGDRSGLTLAFVGGTIELRGLPPTRRSFRAACGTRGRRAFARPRRRVRRPAARAGRAARATYRRRPGARLLGAGTRRARAPRAAPLPDRGAGGVAGAPPPRRRRAADRRGQDLGRVPGDRRPPPQHAGRRADARSRAPVVRRVAHDVRRPGRHRRRRRVRGAAADRDDVRLGATCTWSTWATSSGWSCSTSATTCPAPRTRWRRARASRRSAWG